MCILVYYCCVIRSFISYGKLLKLNSELDRIEQKQNMIIVEHIEV